MNASAQDTFIIRATKDSLDGFKPFYDMQEKTMDIMFAIKPSVDPEIHQIEFALQAISFQNNQLDIYNGLFDIPSSTFIYAVPINDTFLKSGSYKLICRLQTKSEQKLIEEKSIQIQMLRKPNNYYRLRNSNSFLPVFKHSNEHIDISTTFVNKYDLARVRSNIYALAPIADKPEQNTAVGILKNNDINELRRFFYNFWYKRNTQDPEAEWKTYADKLNYCARKFSYGGYKGYQTDMGRIYINHGPPNRMIKAANERGTKPYEIWYYAQFGPYNNINIIFAQIGNMANERVILHSSEPGYYYNPYWANQLFTDPQERFNTNSHRVYDFFKPQ